MGIGVHINDCNSGEGVKVSNNTLHVTAFPPSLKALRELQGIENKLKYFTAYVKNTSGAYQMTVDGSVTPQVFSLKSDPDKEYYIRFIVLVLASTTVALNKFGNLNKLTNGFDFEFLEAGVTTYIFEKCKTGGNLVLQSGMTDVFGSGSSVYSIPSYEGNDNAIVIPINFERFVPGGIRMAIGSENQFKATVRDNLTGLTEFYIRVIGYYINE